MPTEVIPPRSFGLTVSQGRVADRTDGALQGSRVAGAALGAYFGGSPVVVGAPTPSAVDDWSVALPAAGETLTDLANALNATLDAGETPLLITNTCAASLGTLPTVARRHPDAVVRWIDAHGDFNTPDTTESGYLGGLDIDPAESRLLADAGVRVLAPAESTAARVAELVGGREVWIHVDRDVLEPGYIPAAYRVDGGLRPHQIADIFRALRDQVRGVELAEFEYGDPEVRRT